MSRLNPAEFSRTSAMISKDKTSTPFAFTIAAENTVLITSQHAQSLQQLIELGHFLHFTSEQLYQVFGKHAVDQSLDEAKFMDCIKELCPHLMEKDAAAKSAMVLEKLKSIYHHFTRDFTTFVNAYEIAAGFSLFVKGSKSDKLLQGFLNFAKLQPPPPDLASPTTRRRKRSSTYPVSNDATKLNCFELWRFLRSIMIVILSLNESQLSLTKGATIAQVVEKGVMRIMKAISQQGASEESGPMSPITDYSFESFGVWYNRGGYQELSWLELLDLKKWSFVSEKFTLFSGSTLSNATTLPATDAIVLDSGSGGSVPLSSISTIASTSSVDAVPGIHRRELIVLEFSLIPPFSTNQFSSASSLTFNNNDLYYVHRILGVIQEVTSNQGLSIGDFVNTFDTYLSASSSIDYHVYQQAYELIFPSKATTSSTEFLKTALASLFLAFNRFGTGEVDGLELVLGLTILCAGSKSEKLALGFQLLDQQIAKESTSSTGVLTRRAMWRFLRSFLTVLLTLGNGAHLSAEELAITVDNAAIHLTQVIFDECELLKDGHSTFISFEQFAKWYGGGGYEQIPWIELLDAKKWPNVSDSAILAIEKAKQSQQLISADSICRSDPSIAFCFPLTLEEHSTSFLKLKMRDVAQFFLLKDQFTSEDSTVISFEEIRDSLQSYALKGERYIKREGFLMAVKEFSRSQKNEQIPSEEAQEYLGYHLDRLFSLYDLESSDTVDIAHIMCGLSFFCDGSFQQKLAKLFLLFMGSDQENNSKMYVLSRRQYYELIRSLLIFLCSFTFSTLRLHSISEKTAALVVSNLFVETISERADKLELRLDEFMQWYTSIVILHQPNTRTLVEWMVLLDLANWPSRDVVEQECQKQPVMQAFNLYEQNNVFQFTDNDVSLFLYVVQATGLRHIDVDILHEIIITKGNHEQNAVPNAKTDQWITREEYHQCLNQLILLDDLRANPKILHLLDRVFSIYDHQQKNMVNCFELACGLTMFGYGSKSRKLAQAFHLFCDRREAHARGQTSVTFSSIRKKSNGYVSEGQLFLFLRSIVLGFMALSEYSSSSSALKSADLIADQTIRQIINDLSSYSTRQRPFLSFEDFGEWYNNGGYVKLAWIELLDIQKWEPKAKQRQASSQSNILEVLSLYCQKNETQDDEEAQRPILEFAISLDGRELHFAYKDIANFRQLLADTELYALNGQEVILQIQTQQIDEVDLDAFSICIEDIVGKSEDSFSETTLEFLSLLHSSVYAVSENEDQISAASGQMCKTTDLICALLVFSSGSLKEKLIWAFSVLTPKASSSCMKNQHELLTECFKYWLAALYSLTLDPNDMVISIIEGACESVHSFLGDIDHPPNASGDHSIINAFDEWFSDRGHRIVPWVELISLQHWPVALKLAEHNAN